MMAALPSRHALFLHHLLGLGLRPRPRRRGSARQPEAVLTVEQQAAFGAGGGHRLALRRTGMHRFLGGGSIIRLLTVPQPNFP